MEGWSIGRTTALHSMEVTEWAPRSLKSAEMRWIPSKTWEFFGYFGAFP